MAKLDAATSVASVQVESYVSTAAVPASAMQPTGFTPGFQARSLGVSWGVLRKSCHGVHLQDCLLGLLQYDVR